MTHRILRTAFPLTVALALASGVAAAGGPKTPLGKWMKANMGTSLAGQDFSALQKNFGTLASNPPPSGDYGQWSSFAKTGQSAAAKQDVSAVKAACKDCHDNYKTKYRKDFPTRPFP